MEAKVHTELVSRETRLVLVTYSLVRILPRQPVHVSSLNYEGASSPVSTISRRPRYCSTQQIVTHSWSAREKFASLINLPTTFLIINNSELIALY